MQMMLKPLDNGDPIALDKAILLFGRHPDCDVVLTFSRKVSRKHCCIAQIDNSFVVRDLGSMNGIRVNQEDPRKEARLKPGDELWIGDVGYRLEIVQPGKNEPPPLEPGSDDVPVPGVRRVSPDLLSREEPIAIPEEGHDFVVEETHRKAKPDSKSSNGAGRAKPRKQTPEKSDEVIVLGDDDILN